MRRPRLRYVLISVLAVVVLGAAAAVLLLPRFARPLLVWQLQGLTGGRSVTIDAVDLGLSTGRLSIRGVRVMDRDGAPLVEFDSLEGRFHRRSLLQAHVWFESLTLANPRLRIVRLPSGKLNIADLLERPASSGDALATTIDRFTIAGGAVAFEDRLLQPARTWRADDIRLDMRDASTRTRAGTAVASTTVAGALVSVLVEELQLSPVHARARINVRDLDLRLIALYLPTDRGLVLERGTLDAGLTIVQDATEGTLIDAEGVVSKLALRNPPLPGEAATAPEVRFLVRDLRQRGATTALRYASLEGDVTVLDPTTTPPRPLLFDDLTATVSGVEDLGKASARLEVHANVPGGGEFDIGGALGLSPVRADLRVKVRRVEMAALAPYLPLQGRLEGVASADVRAVVTPGSKLGITLTGEASLDKVVIGDATRRLIGADRLTVNGLRYTFPASVSAAQITVTKPRIRVERDEGGVIGLAKLLRPAAPAAASPAPAAATADLAIARLVLHDGRMVVTDAATGGRVDLRNIALAAENVTWPGGGASRVNLATAVAGGELKADGTIDSARRSAELALKLRGIDLATAEPWLPIAGKIRGAVDGDVTVALAMEPFSLALRGTLGAANPALLDGDRPVVSAGRVDATGIDLQWPTRLAIDQVRVNAPVAHVDRDAQGGLPMRALLERRADRPAPATEPAAAPAPAGPPLEISVRDARIEDGRAVVNDAGSGARVEAERVSVRAGDVTWPARGPMRVQVSAALLGGEVTARGTVDAGRRTGDLAVTAKGVDLGTIQPWVPVVARLRGALDADVTVAAAMEPFTLALRGALGVGNLAFLQGDTPMLTVARVEAGGIDLQWPTKLAIDRLRVNTPWAHVARNTQGELTLRALFARRADLAPRPPPEPVAAATPGPVPGLQLSVRDALFENGGGLIVDDSVEPAARFDMKGSHLHVQNLTWPARGAAAVRMETPMPGHGTLKARGTLSVEPTRLQLDVDLDQIDLAPARPYLPLDARLNGRLSGRARVDGTFGETVKLTITGSSTLERLALGDAERRLATVQRAELTEFRYVYPTGVRIKQLTLRKPWMLVERDADGVFELAALLTAKKPPTATAAAPPAVTPVSVAAPPAPPAPPARVRVLIASLTMDDGFIRFVDRSTTPAFAEEISKVTFTGQGLGTRSDRRAKVDLQGVFASGTPLSVKGEVGGLLGPRYLDLTVDVREYPAPRANPYLRKLGWTARQGTLTASLRYKLNGDDLDASNIVTLTALEVDRAPGADGKSMPLDLVVSLLKDRQNNIKLNVPVRGRVTSPEFDYGDALRGALRNLVIRLVALPFSLVGKLFFSEDSRIESVAVDPVPFETAKAAPTAAGAQQLGQLATFLREAPAIRLRLRPVTTVTDVNALRRAALNERLATLGADEAARRQAAVGLYTEMFPRRTPPATDEALYDELTRETPTPPRALRTLATERVAAVRHTLVKAGIAAERLEPLDSRAAVESEGTARVEFEIAQ